MVGLEFYVKCPAVFRVLHGVRVVLDLAAKFIEHENFNIAFRAAPTSNNAQSTVAIPYAPFSFSCI